MNHYAPPLEKLIEQFEKLPGVGHKSAQRLAFFVLSMGKEEAQEFAKAIMDAKTAIRTCKVCQNLCEGDLCPICSDKTRDFSTVCVVADPKDLIAIERTREYKGVYHVLHGVISPLSGIGPEDIKIKELLQRIADSDIKEVILATNPDTEGETTAMYIARLLRPFEVKTTRLAYGMPVGGHLEFSDQKTLSMAIEGRREIK